MALIDSWVEVRFEPASMSVSQLSGLPVDRRPDTKRQASQLRCLRGFTPAQESADLIFLIDGSSNLGSAEFQFIHSFIVNFIEDLDIGPDAIQTGMVQYSTTPRTQFYLNTYPTKIEVLNAVKNLRQKGGDEANTGTALQFLIDNHFIPSAGSRAAEGVPQVMVLMTSRKSSDDVRQGVFSIKKQGTFTFVVGVGDADAAEAKLIATDPSFSMLNPDFQQMATIRQKLMSLFSLVAKKLLVIEVQESKFEAQVSKRDIIFLIDGSSSVGNANFLQICEFILNIINKFVIGPDSVQVAVVQYSGVATTEFHLNTHTTQSALQTALKRLRPRGGWALNTGAALDYVFRNHFTRAAGSRKEDDVPQLLVLITGERSRDDVKQPAEILKRAAVMTFAIGDRNADPAQLKEIAIDPSLVFNVDEFQYLPEVQEQVMTPLSTLAGVTIVYEHPTVPVKKVIKMDKRDIVFLIDGSYNVGRRNLDAIRDFITGIIEAFDIGSDGVRVGLVQYSDVAEVEFFLNTYSSKDELLSHLRRLRLRGGTVLKTGEALNYVLRYLFTKYSGSRQEEGVPQFLVLVTGGKSRDEMKQPLDALLQAGVTTLAIGTENAIKQQLQEVSMNPSLVFGVKEFRSLPEIQQEVLIPLSTLTGERKNSELPTTPITKVVTEADKRDIVFLIDGSFHVGSTNLPAIRDFIIRIIETLDIGSDKVRVGLVQYSDVAEPEFFLNTYSSKDELISEVNRLRLRGGTMLKTGAALDYVHKYIFTKYSGSRKEEGVPQFLVLVTGGRSRDDIKPPSDALLRSGVMTLAIGAENAIKKQLQEAALDPSLVYSVKEFNSLPEIQKDVLLTLSTLTGVKIISELPTMKNTKDIIDTQERDIVFLIDGSTKAGSSFHFVREFLSGVIQQLNVGLNRIAVVQYSKNAKVEFLLNTYSSKDDTLNAVEKLRPKGGSVLNTGAALNYVIRNVFTTAAGSRRDVGVPQLLVLLISGKSRDNVKEAAEALKRAAIVTFVIGAMDADGKELQEIAYSSNLLFAVQDFQSLPDIQDQLLQPLKTLIVEIIKMPSSVTEGNKRDVVFLIDSSSNVGTFFYLIRDLIINLIPNFDIAKDKDQIAVVQYSDDARIEFPLNAHTSKEQVLAAARKLRLKGGKRLKTGAALDFVRRNVFSRSGGGRRHLGISQILMLITSGKSQDDVRQPSEELKQAGVVSFAVGIGDVDRSE
uniref:collagen alpha-3(VI) chain-like n=1 Tax=Pristiophorus japonicus TaxID=55135 RepID=UPI00398E8434